MRAAVLRSGTIGVETLDDPRPGPGQLLVAPRHTGICGSDLHMREIHAAVAAATPDSPREPLVLGHEFAGEVLAIGPDTATALALGDRVAVLPFTRGSAGAETVGLSTAFPGGLAELTVVDAATAYRLPEGLGTDLGALCEPLAVSLHALGLACPDGPIVVVGAGPVGLGVIAVAALAGRHPLLAVDPSATRREMAERLGADIAIPPGTTLRDLLGSFGQPESPASPFLRGDPAVATIVECVGRPEVVQQLIAEAPGHSRLVIAGACHHDVTFNPIVATLGELDMRFSFAYRPDEFEAAGCLLRDHSGTFEPLITSRRPLEATNQAFDDLSGETVELKILISP